MDDSETQVSSRSADRKQSWLATVEQMLEPVYQFVRSRAPADAVDDIVQETFTAASRGISAFDGRCPIWNWLVAIARNKIAEHYRRAGRGDPLAEAVDALGDDEGRTHQALVSESPLPPDICERREFAALARAALSSLCPDERACLVGRYYEGLSLDQLSGRLGISRPAANTRLHRARQSLREAFMALLARQDRYRENGL